MLWVLPWFRLQLVLQRVQDWKPAWIHAIGSIRVLEIYCCYPKYVDHFLICGDFQWRLACLEKFPHLWIPHHTNHSASSQATTCTMTDLISSLCHGPWLHKQLSHIRMPPLSCYMQGHPSSLPPTFQIYSCQTMNCKWRENWLLKSISNIHVGHFTFRIYSTLKQFDVETYNCQHHSFDCKTKVKLFKRKEIRVLVK